MLQAIDVQRVRLLGEEEVGHEDCEDREQDAEDAGTDQVVFHVVGHDHVFGCASMF